MQVVLLYYLMYLASVQLSLESLLEQMEIPQSQQWMSMIKDISLLEELLMIMVFCSKLQHRAFLLVPTSQREITMHGPNILRPLMALQEILINTLKFLMLLSDMMESVLPLH